MTVSLITSTPSTLVETRWRQPPPRLNEGIVDLYALLRDYKVTEVCGGRGILYGVVVVLLCGGCRCEMGNVESIW